MRCDLQIFSGCVCHLEQLHAQSPFLFPIVFSINITQEENLRQEIDHVKFEVNSTSRSGFFFQEKKSVLNKKKTDSISTLH